MSRYNLFIHPERAITMMARSWKRLDDTVVRLLMSSPMDVKLVGRVKAKRDAVAGRIAQAAAVFADEDWEWRAVFKGMK